MLTIRLILQAYVNCKSSICFECFTSIELVLLYIFDNLKKKIINTLFLQKSNFYGITFLTRHDLRENIANNRDVANMK